MPVAPPSAVASIKEKGETFCRNMERVWSANCCVASRGVVVFSTSDNRSTVFSQSVVLSQARLGNFTESEHT